MPTIQDSLTQLSAFFDQGGDVLYIIFIATFILWTLALERVWYFRGPIKSDVNAVIDEWEARSERRSVRAHQIRRAKISQVSEKINAGLPMIQTLVALCPLLGLLGTVTGMIEVFNIMAVTGGGDAKSMAGGVSKATIPTMAGMVAALSGVFASSYIDRTASRETALLEDHLTMDH